MSRAKADRKYALKKKYGISLSHYDAMLERQGGRCAICRKKPGRRRLAVDHDHKTKRVRGLVCTYCNYFVLGFSKGLTPDGFRRAADYLEKPPGVPWHVAPPPMRPKGDRMIELGILKRIKTRPQRKIKMP